MCFERNVKPNYVFLSTEGPTVFNGFRLHLQNAQTEHYCKTFSDNVFYLFFLPLAIQYQLVATLMFLWWCLGNPKHLVKVREQEWSRLIKKEKRKKLTVTRDRTCLLFLFLTKSYPHSGHRIQDMKPALHCQSPVRCMASIHHDQLAITPELYKKSQFVDRKNIASKYNPGSNYVSKKCKAKACSRT